MNKNKKGFTLTEILTVVLIIAILAAAVYPMYSKSVARARTAEAVNLLLIIRNKQLQKFVKDRSYYDSFSEMGRLTASPLKEHPQADGSLKIGDYILAFDTASKCITAEYKKGKTEFTFSANYDEPGIGCKGAICGGFEDIVKTDFCAAP